MTAFKGYKESFGDGILYVSGDVGFAYQGSGNEYRAAIEVAPCDESSTGHCITAQATGVPLGEEPVACRNY